MFIPNSPVDTKYNSLSPQCIHSVLFTCTSFHYFPHALLLPCCPLIVVMKRIIPNYHSLLLCRKKWNNLSLMLIQGIVTVHCLAENLEQAIPKILPKQLVWIYQMMKPVNSHHDVVDILAVVTVVWLVVLIIVADRYK